MVRTMPSLAVSAGDAKWHNIAPSPCPRRGDNEARKVAEKSDNKAHQIINIKRETDMYRKRHAWIGSCKIRKDKVLW